ncbi:hypothetical protein ACWOHQ_004390 [Vibrio parahaemolyticus]
MIYSEDAPALENDLHKRFDFQSINRLIYVNNFLEPRLVKPNNPLKKMALLTFIEAEG